MKKGLMVAAVLAALFGAFAVPAAHADWDDYGGGFGLGLGGLGLGLGGFGGGYGWGGYPGYGYGYGGYPGYGFGGYDWY